MGQVVVYSLCRSKQFCQRVTTPLCSGRVSMDLLPYCACACITQQVHQKKRAVARLYPQDLRPEIPQGRVWQVRHVLSACRMELTNHFVISVRATVLYLTDFAPIGT